MTTAVEPGAVIDGKYRVIRRIGEGGMGTVYEGENIRIERKVAIKVLHAHVASSAEFAQRFEREARASARIGSPYVCDVLDLGDLPGGERFLVMEFLEGESLEDRLMKGPMTAKELAPIAFEILEGLGTMHQAGVVHRDLKPANIFLQRRGKGEVVKILDFGVAKILARADEPGQMTSTGMMMGTPLYMSPEQARGARDVDGRTDIYAASVIFYRALTGEMPHLGDNLHELLFKIVLEDPKPIREIVPDVDERFAEIVTRGLSRDPDQRFLSAREYQEDIAAWGIALGQSTLQFALTLPSQRPPLQSLSGGFPVSKLQTPITGPQPSEKVGPPTPVLAKTQGSPAAKSGGTPIVWSEDAPAIAKEAHAKLEAQKKAQREKATAAAQSAATDKTQLLDVRPPMPTPTNDGAPAPAPPTRASGKGPLVGIAAALVIAAVAVGLKIGGSSSHASSSTPSSVSAPAVVVDPAIVVPSASSAVAPVATTSSEPTASGSASAAPVAPPVIRTSTPVASPNPANPSVVSAATGRPGATMPATSAAPPSAPTAAAPTPALTASGRKFRKNLD